jgi:hypothetical protein
MSRSDFVPTTGGPATTRLGYPDQPQVRATKLRSSWRHKQPSRRQEEIVADINPQPPGSKAIGLLVDEIGRAAQAGWAQTARMIALLTVAAAAVALVLMASR